MLDLMLSGLFQNNQDIFLSCVDSLCDLFQKPMEFKTAAEVLRSSDSLIDVNICAFVCFLFALFVLFFLFFVVCSLFLISLIGFLCLSKCQKPESSSIFNDCTKNNASAPYLC
jgi:hypothetical protein